MITNNDVWPFRWHSTKDLSLQEAGVPLDTSTRSWMESRFGRSFGDVRVHTGPWAAAAARALHARAFTFGSHIFCAAGQYAPHTTEGRRLLAHELVHVVQQRGVLVTTDHGCVGVGDARDPLEAEAERVADEVLGSGPISSIHRDLAPAIRRVVQIDPDSKASLTVDASVLKAKPKVDILTAGTNKIAFNHLTEGFNPANAIAGKFPMDELVIKMVGKFDVVMDPGDKLLDFQFGIIQIGQVFALEDTYVGRTLNEGHTFMKHRLNVSPNTLLDSEASFAPFASRLPDFDQETKGQKTISHNTCHLGIVADPKKKGDSPHGFSAAVVKNRKTNADNFLFEHRTDLGFTSVLVAIDPQKKVQPLVHVNWHLVWHFQFRWKGTTDPTATAIPIKTGADFSQPIKGAPTDTAIAALVAKPAGAFMNDVTTRAKQQTALGQPPNREDNFSRPGNIPADFFT